MSESTNVCPDCKTVAEHSFIMISTDPDVKNDVLCATCGGLTRLRLVRETVDEDTLTDIEQGMVKTVRKQLKEGRTFQ